MCFDWGQFIQVQISLSLVTKSASVGFGFHHSITGIALMTEFIEQISILGVSGLFVYYS